MQQPDDPDEQPADELLAVLGRLCRSPRNDGVLDAELLGLLLDPDPTLVRTDTDGDVWVPRDPTDLAERFGAGRKQVEQAIARLLARGFVRAGVDHDGAAWVGADPGAVADSVRGLDREG